MAMKVRGLQERILAFLDSGWRIDVHKYPSGNRGYQIFGPTGNFYDYRKLERNQCTICEDNDPEEFCFHDEKDLVEEKKARNLAELIGNYERPMEFLSHKNIRRSSGTR